MKIIEKYQKMCEYQYCRACLVTGVKMISPSSRNSYNKNVETFSKILEIPVALHKQCFCFECASLLAKYEQFRSKCYNAQKILSAIRTENAKEMYNHILNIDRKQNRLTSNLSPSETKYHDNQVLIITHDDTIHEQDTDNIKNELMEHDELNEFDFEDMTNYSSPEYKFDSEIKHNKRKRKKDQTKNKSLKKSKHNESSSDNEPLANKITKTAGNNINNANGTNQITDIKIHSANKKLRIAKKIDSDFEEYATVVFLSLDDAKKEVLLRKESSNYINSHLKCDLCYRGYEAMGAFENHMKKHSIEYGEYQCDICHLRFPEQRYLCKHRLASHKRKFCCKICPYVCFCMHQAKTHVSLHKGKKYPCKECREVFSMPNSLLMHKRQKHATECVCELCGHTFATPRGLYSHHMKLHRQVHINEKLGPKCEECSKHFATEAAWKVHLVLSSKHDVSNGCKYCGETFSTSQELKSHQRVHARKHVRRDCIDVPALCSMCDKWLHDRAEYISHVNSAHPQSEAAKKMDAVTPFVCEVCGKMFKKQCFLTYHQRKHSGERPYKCGECDKTFQLAGALSTHRAVHLNKRAYKCGICARVFTFKSVLNKHMKVHLGIRPHRCDICDKSFISPCDVKVHIKYVHNKVPWPKRDRTKLNEPSFVPY